MLWRNIVGAMDDIELGGFGADKDVATLKKQVRTACCCAGFGVFIGWLSFGIAVATPAGLISGWEPFVHPTGVVLSSAGAVAPDGYVLGDSVFKGQGQWAEIPAMPRQLSDLSAVVFQADDEDMVMILGGMDENDACSNAATQYDPLLKKYTELAPMPSPRVRFAAAFANGRVFVAGGFLCSGPNGTVDALATDTVHVYEVAAGTWSNGASTAVKRADPCAPPLGILFISSAGTTPRTITPSWGQSRYLTLR